MHRSEQSGKAMASGWDLHFLLRYMQRESRIYTEANGSVWTSSNIEAVCRRLVLIAMPHKYMESLQLLHNASGTKRQALLQSADYNQHYCSWYTLLIRADEISLEKYLSSDLLLKIWNGHHHTLWRCCWFSFTNPSLGNSYVYFILYFFVSHFGPVYIWY